MTTLERVAPDWEPTPSITLTTSMPSTTEPKTTCLPSSQAVSEVHRKNWLPLVPGPAFACMKGRNSQLSLHWLQWDKSKRKSNQNLAPVFRSLESHHAQDSRASVLQLEVFIFKTRAIDGLSTSPVVVGEIPPLAHAIKIKERQNEEYAKWILMKVSEDNQ